MADRVQDQRNGGDVKPCSKMLQRGHGGGDSRRTHSNRNGTRRSEAPGGKVMVFELGDGV